MSALSSMGEAHLKKQSVCEILTKLFVSLKAPLKPLLLEYDNFVQMSAMSSMGGAHLKKQIVCEILTKLFVGLKAPLKPL